MIKSLLAIWAVAIAFTFLLVTQTDANKAVQKWVVPPGVTKIRVTYTSPLGITLSAKVVEVQPGHVFEWVPLQ
jgi:multisubunit Na+/H+ antiporter MnhE subunit